MTGKLTIFAVPIAVLPLLTHAQTAAQPPATVTMAVAAGTLGDGPEIGYRHNRLIGIRADAEFLCFSYDVHVDQIKYHGDVRQRGYGATADLYPFKNELRISASVRINEGKIKIVAGPQQSVTVGHTIYTPDQIGTINGNIRANKVVPVLTLGYAHNLHKGLTWSADGGVMLWDKAEVYDISATGQQPGLPEQSYSGRGQDRKQGGGIPRLSGGQAVARLGLLNEIWGVSRGHRSILRCPNVSISPF